MKYVAFVPSGLGQYVGQVAFEQARGVVMEVCGFTADEALAALSAFTSKTDLDVELIVSRLRTTPMAYAPLMCD